MTYQRAYRSAESRRLQAEIARASREHSPDADRLPELRRRMAVSIIADKFQQAVDKFAPLDGLTDLDRRALRAAAHRVIDDAPGVET